MRPYFAAVLICIFIIYGPTEGEAIQIETAFVRSPAGTAPAKCYEIRRDGEKIKPRIQDQPVFHQDEIIPLNGKRVVLIYHHTDCARKTVDKPIKVNCLPRKLSKSEWLTGYFIKLLRKGKILPDPKEETDATVTMGPDAEKENIKCFPDVAFRLSPLPKQGSAVLAGESVYFRRDDYFLDEDVPPCSEAQLVISEKTSGKTIKKAIKIGQLIQVESSVFEAGKSYQWRIENKNGPVSEDYHFTVLNQKESDAIRAQLKYVGQACAKKCAGLKQAMYLDFKSIATPGLDLSSDSFRLRWENKECNDNK